MSRFLKMFLGLWAFKIKAYSFNKISTKFENSTNREYIIRLFFKMVTYWGGYSKITGKIIVYLEKSSSFPAVGLIWLLLFQHTWSLNCWLRLWLSCCAEAKSASNFFLCISQLSWLVLVELETVSISENSLWATLLACSILEDSSLVINTLVSFIIPGISF